MMKEEIVILKENGKKKVKIEVDGKSVCLSTMRNGFQWSGQPIDEELADLIIDILSEYKKYINLWGK